MLWFYENDSILTLHFSAFTKTTDTFNKKNDVKDFGKVEQCLWQIRTSQLQK